LYLCVFHIPTCFISLHISHPYAFYLSEYFTPQVSRLVMFYFYMFHTFKCFISHHVLCLCMLQILSCFVSLHVLRPFMFKVAPCFISVCFESLNTFQETGAFHEGLYSEVPDDVYEHYGHFGRDTEHFCTQASRFRKKIVPYTHPEDVSSTFLRNISTYLPA
jgi:hypothetical protein